MKKILALTLLLIFSVNTALAWTYYQEYKSPSYFKNKAATTDKEQLFSTQNNLNPYSTFQSPYNKESARRNFDKYSAKIKDYNGNFQGQASPQISDPKSVTNPYGKYGKAYSPYSAAKPYVPQKWNNPYSVFQNPYDPQSVHNNPKYGVQYHDSFGNTIGSTHPNSPYPHAVNGSYPKAPFKKYGPANPYDPNKVFN